MTKKILKSKHADDLRRRAEKRIPETLENIKGMSAAEIQKLVHELNVHQIELEMQNEALRRSQVETAESQYKYTDLYDFAPVGYFTLDKKGHIIEANVTGASLFGAEKRSLIGQPFHRFIHTSYFNIFRSHLQKAHELRSKQICKIKITRKDGSVFDALIDTIPVIDGEGNIDHCRSSVTDITEVTRAEEAEETIRAIHSGEVDALVVSTEHGDQIFTLAGAEKPYRIMMETMNEGAVTMVPDGTILYCNQRFADMVKTPLENIIGNSINRFIKPGEETVFEEFIRQVSKSDRKEISLQSADGMSMPMLLSMSDLGDATSGAICLLVTDIGELRQVQQSLQESRDELEIKIEKRTRELRESEERYRELVQSAPDAVIVHRDREFLYANPVALRLFGAESLEELRSRAVLDLIHADDRAAIAMSMEQRQAGQRLPLQETRLVRLDGRVVPVESVGGVIKYDGKLAMQTIIRDITERRQMEKALQKAHDGLEQQVEERTVELRTALSEIITLKEQLEAENIYFRHENKMKRQFEHIIGQSDGLKYVLYRAEQVAPLNTTVLILGETGTGKELIAFAIHDMSPRKERPLITVNCAALPGNLIESELFGREKGAFTGADTRQVGRFEVAHNSTLCLDEIGELPLEVQAKLLRVIQHNEFERLGSSHTVKVDVRVIATTNRDLEEEVRKGRFRQDLYYRLNVFPITVPPLRQRKEDIPLMVQAFMERYSRKLGKQITSIRNETMKELQDYPWPGNVRELESIIERAVILCPGSVLQLADKLEISSSPLLSAVRTLEDTERHQILKILSETRWRIEGKDGAAAILGLHPSTLRARMYKLGIVRPETKESN